MMYSFDKKSVSNRETEATRIPLLQLPGQGAGGFSPVVLTFCSVVTVVEPPGVEMVVSF
jgi:hypothetical protein